MNGIGTTNLIAKYATINDSVKVMLFISVSPNV